MGLSKLGAISMGTTSENTPNEPEMQVIQGREDRVFRQNERESLPVETSVSSMK